ncbi:MAG: flagellar hook-length control protein FliK, partial [Piscinibacter sp.]|nr:flagellar hook-length control protein FliK [Piscinibacter sp.]
MMAMPLPTPPERSDAMSRGATPEPATQRHESGRFADLLRQRRVDAAAKEAGPTAASQDDDAQDGSPTATTNATTNAAAAPRARPTAARDAKQVEVTRAETECVAATPGETQAAAEPVSQATDESAATDAPALPSTDNAGVPIAAPAQVDVQTTPRGDAPQTAPGLAAAGRPARAAVKAEADAADAAAQRATTVAGTAQEAPSAAAAAAAMTLPAAADSSRPAPVALSLDTSLPAGTSLSLPRNAEVALPAVPSVALPAPVASPEFGELLGAQVSLFARDGLQQAELRLNPAEMGPIGVQIEIAGNEARINFNAGQATTRDAIERALPELAAALRGEGLTLAGGGVFDRPPGAREGTPARANPGTRRVGGGRVVALPAAPSRGFAPQ